MERTTMVTAAMAQEMDTMEIVTEMVATAAMAGTVEAMGVAMGAGEMVVAGMEAAAAVVVGVAVVEVVVAENYRAARKLTLRLGLIAAQ